MIKYEKNGKVCTVQASGSLGEEINDCCVLIHSIYASIARHNEMAAAAFKLGIMMAVADKDGGIWDTSKNANPSYELYYEGKNDGK